MHGVHLRHVPRIPRLGAVEEIRLVEVLERRGDLVPVVPGPSVGAIRSPPLGTPPRAAFICSVVGTMARASVSMSTSPFARPFACLATNSAKSASVGSTLMRRSALRRFAEESVPSSSVSKNRKRFSACLGVASPPLAFRRWWSTAASILRTVSEWSPPPGLFKYSLELCPPGPEPAVDFPGRAASAGSMACILASRAASTRLPVRHPSAMAAFRAPPRGWTGPWASGCPRPPPARGCPRAGGAAGSPAPGATMSPSERPPRRGRIHEVPRRVRVTPVRPPVLRRGNRREVARHEKLDEFGVVEVAVAVGVVLGEIVDERGIRGVDVEAEHRLAELGRGEGVAVLHPTPGDGHAAQDSHRLGLARGPRHERGAARRPPRLGRCRALACAGDVIDG